MKKAIWKKMLLLAAVTSLLLAVSGCSLADGDKEAAKNQEDSAEDQTDTVQNNKGIFAEMETEDLDGTKVDSSIFADHKLTLVNVWNTGCTPCIQEIPVLDRLNKEYEGKGVSIKGLIYELDAGLSDSGRQDVEEILKKADADYQHLTVSDDMNRSKELQNLMAFPTTYFVNSKGQIIETLEGARDYENWKKVIEDVLQEMGDE